MGFEQGLGVPRHRGGTGVGGTGVGGTHQSGTEVIAGWGWGVRGSWAAAPWAGRQRWRVRGCWGALPQAKGQRRGAGGHRGAALGAGGQRQPHSLQHSPAVQQRRGAAAHDALADARDVLALGVTVASEGSPGSPPGLPPLPRQHSQPAGSCCSSRPPEGPGGTGRGDEHEGMAPSQLGTPRGELSRTPCPLSPARRVLGGRGAARPGHSPPTASLPAGHRAGRCPGWPKSH